MTETAGLKLPPDILPPTKITHVNINPIAYGFPVAIITYKKIKVPMNSIIHLFNSDIYKEKKLSQFKHCHSHVLRQSIFAFELSK